MSETRIKEKFSKGCASPYCHGLYYDGRSWGRRSITKMALLLEDVGTDALVYHDRRPFAFEDMERTGVAPVIEARSIERLDTADLSDSIEIDNVNILKQLRTTTVPTSWTYTCQFASSPQLAIRAFLPNGGTSTSIPAG